MLRRRLAQPVRACGPSGSSTATGAAALRHAAGEREALQPHGEPGGVTDLQAVGRVIAEPARRRADPRSARRGARSRSRDASCRRAPSRFRTASGRGGGPGSPPASPASTGSSVLCRQTPADRARARRSPPRTARRRADARRASRRARWPCRAGRRSRPGQLDRSQGRHPRIREDRLRRARRIASP